MKTIFQILDAYAQDLEIQVETDTTREVAYIGAESDDDDEVHSRRRSKAAVSKTTKRKRMVIHLFGTTPEGKSVRANVEGFEPFFYVRLPFATKSTQQEFQQRVSFWPVPVETILSNSQTANQTLRSLSVSASYSLAIPVEHRTPLPVSRCVPSQPGAGSDHTFSTRKPRSRSSSSSRTRNRSKSLRRIWIPCSDSFISETSSPVAGSRAMPMLKNLKTTCSS